ncbi:MAG: ATP-binding protein [Chloroflexota bacterium]
MMRQIRTTFSTIRARIALLLAILMLIVLIGAALFLYFSLSIQLQSALDDGLRLSAEQLLTTIDYNGGHHVFRYSSEQQERRNREDDLVRLLLADGQTKVWDGERDNVSVIWPSGDEVQFKTVPYASDGPRGNNSQRGKGNPQRFDFGFSELRDGLRLISIPLFIGDEAVEWLQVGRSTKDIYETLSSLMFLFFLVTPLVLLATIGSGYWLAGRVLRPIETIRQQAAAISAQDLSKRLGLELPDDEVGRLATTFDQMLERLDESFRNQQRFVSDASHELRTPLAVISGEVDVVLENPRQPDDYINSLETIGSEASRMGRLVHDLLLLAQTDRAELPLKVEENDLADMLHVLVETMEPRAEAARVTIELDLPSTMQVWGDSDRLIQLFLNLLDNALIYAPHSHITISGHQDEQQATIQIADSGPGIAPTHVSRLFERFYRVDKSRSRDNGGSGLGLAIVREIAEAHRGKVSVNSQLGEGTTFTVRLPIQCKIER